MKITIYTIKDCAFSKQEKEYLNTNKLVFEEKDLEVNKDFLTEMLAISNNFAGTPVTKVEKDDGSISVLKGFTKEEFDKIFGFMPTPADNQSPVAPSSTTTGQINDIPVPSETPPKVEDVKPVAEVVPLVETIPPTSVPTNVEPIEQTATPDLSAEASVKADPLRSVMDDLQSKSQQAGQPPTSPLPPDSPSIPDFPAK